MASRMIELQRRAFLAQCQDDARRLVHSLANLSDAQRAGVLAVIAAKTSTPIDIVYIADTGDRDEIAGTVASALRTDPDNQDAYLLGSGCLFQVVDAPGLENHERA